MGLRFAIVTGLWLIFAAINIWPRGWNYTFVNWSWWQWLPREALTQEPVTSVWLLHAQPPVMNALLALFAQLEQAGVMRMATGATLAMALSGWLACAVWFEVAWRLLRSLPLALIVPGLLLLNPGLNTFAVNFFYPNVEMLGLGLLTLQVERWARQPGARRLGWIIAAWGGMIYTRSLWHPVTGGLMALLLGTHLLVRGGGWRRSFAVACACAGLCLALAAPWALKNYYYFNTSAFSSWIGINTQNFLHGTNPLWEYSQNLTDNPEIVRQFYTDKQWARLQGHPAVTIQAKNAEAGFTANMNYLGVPALGAEAVRITREGYLKNPRSYLYRLAEHWIQADLPAYAQIFTYNYQSGDYKLNPPTAYAGWFDRVYYGGWLREHWQFQMLDRTWRPSFNILFIYPVALAGALLRLRRLRRPRGLVSALMLMSIGWVWAMIILIDGNEGFRMRWHVEPAILILFLWSLLDLRRGIQARRLRRAFSHQPSS